jgi:hypothetical protein
MKLEFVPPWLINFIARQLVGHGHKLYQKVLFVLAYLQLERQIEGTLDPFGSSGVQ